MEKRKWLWKKRSSDKSCGETESSRSGSFSSHFERFSDEQCAPRKSSNDRTKSPEVTSKASVTTEELKESVKSLAEKLSAALVNVSAKEDLVKQHAKVAEEAIAGWEKAENEVIALKEQLEASVQQKLNLEDRVSHLDGALKECVKQLRQKQDEHEKKISDAIIEKNKEWELKKFEIEKQILELQKDFGSIDPNSIRILDTLEKQNAFLKQELKSKCNELESLTIERNLSTQAAENASKLQLESAKKIAKLEAECKRLQSIARKSSPPKSVAVSYFCSESLADSHSDSNVETNLSEPDSWVSALITELDHIEIEKPLCKTLPEIDMMDDFLEMERIAALPEIKNSGFEESISMDNRVAELETNLQKIELEKREVETALEEVQKQLNVVNEGKKLLELQLVDMEVESRTMSANIDLMRGEIEKERKLSAELTVKCQELENKLKRTVKETVFQQNVCSNGEVKFKQENLTVAANKLAECQKTIASLGKQLKSLATLEDFLIDTSNIPGFSNDVFCNLDPSKTPRDNNTHLKKNGNVEKTRAPSLLQPSSATHFTVAKSRNGFGKLFSRSKSMRVLNNTDLNRNI